MNTQARQQTLPWALHLVVGWQVLMVLPLVFVPFRYLLGKSLLGNDWLLAGVTSYPYLAVALYTAYKLLCDPPAGRRVALCFPALFLGVDLLICLPAWVSAWQGVTPIAFYWEMNLLYTLCTLPCVIVLLLPAVKRCCDD